MAVRGTVHGEGTPELRAPPLAHRLGTSGTGVRGAGRPRGGGGTHLVPRPRAQGAACEESWGCASPRLQVRARTASFVQSTVASL